MLYSRWRFYEQINLQTILKRIRLTTTIQAKLQNTRPIYLHKNNPYCILVRSSKNAAYGKQWGRVFCNCSKQTIQLNKTKKKKEFHNRPFVWIWYLPILYVAQTRKNGHPRSRLLCLNRLTTIFQKNISITDSKWNEVFRRNSR